MVYHHVFANRTLHVHYPIRIRTRPGEHFPIDWTYFICNCDNGPVTGSEFVMGDAWAGKVKNANATREESANAWRHAIPPCKYRDINHYNVPDYPGARHVSYPRGRLELGLLCANKQINAEARDIPYTSNIFTFDDVRSFASFISSTAGLSWTQLGLLRNISIYMEPRTSETMKWNEWLIMGPKGTGPDRPDMRKVRMPYGLKALNGLRKLQIVVENVKTGFMLSHMRQPWTKLFFVYGLLAFARMGIQDISVDVSLCAKRPPSSLHYNNPADWYMDTDEEVKTAATAYAEMLEKRMRRPWTEEVCVEINKLRKSYANAQREACTRLMSPTYPLDDEDT